MEHIGIVLWILVLVNMMSPTISTDLEADIAIIGGGTAGSVLSRRLCIGLPKLRIVVLEKGSAKDPKYDLYRKSIRMQFDVTRQEFVDQVQSEPVLAFNKRRISIPVGTGIGGATNINGGYVASASNNQYLKAFKHMTIDEIRQAKAMYRNTSRVLPLGPDGQDYGPILTKAVKDTGVPLVTHYSSTPVHEDDQILQETIFTKRGVRQSLDESYISPVIERCPNLHILNDSFVDRVEFVKVNRKFKATGVHYISAGVKHFLKVHREVILSAGGIYTPPILHRSGIGENKLLKRLGISQLVDLPVGYFGNKIITMAFGQYKRPVGSRVNDPAYILSDKSKAKFWAGKDGPLSKGVAGGGGEVLFSGSTCHFSITAETGLTGRNALTADDPGLLFSACMCPSDAKGKVEARSDDPMASPKLTFDFVNSPFDVDKIRKCSKLLSDIVEKLPAEWNATQTHPRGGIKDVEWKNVTDASFHLSSAAAVGPVLYNNYAVRGTKGLRVVDASAVPEGYAYGLFPATMLCAEHASSVIIRDHSVQ